MKPSILSLAIIASAFASCTPPDPVHDRAVERLGAESGNADEYHRAGQPCATCHNAKNGPADTDFSVAGTIFATPQSLAGADGVTIMMTDSAGTSPPPIVTNCAGNFFIPRTVWDPALPIVSVKLSAGKIVRDMRSPIGQSASCADCHQAKIYASDPLSKLGIVYLSDGTAQSPAPTPSPGCPVNPVLGTP